MKTKAVQCIENRQSFMNPWRKNDIKSVYSTLLSILCIPEEEVTASGEGDIQEVLFLESIFSGER